MDVLSRFVNVYPFSLTPTDFINTCYFTELGYSFKQVFSFDGPFFLCATDHENEYKKSHCGLVFFFSVSKTKCHINISTRSS